MKTLKHVTKLVLKLCIILVFTSSCQNKKPKKFNTVPNKAVWKGGIDEGFWIHLTSKQDNLYRFKIYDDFNGKLALDGYFKITGECKKISRMNTKELLKAIFVFEDNTILFKDLECKLLLKPPILDGRMK